MTLTPDQKERIAREYLNNTYNLGAYAYGSVHDMVALSPMRAYVLSALAYWDKKVGAVLNDEEIINAMPTWDFDEARYVGTFEFTDWATDEGWPVFERFIDHMTSAWPAGEWAGWLSKLLEQFEEEERDAIEHTKGCEEAVDLAIHMDRR